MTQPFHFPDGRVANNAQDLLELCEQYPDQATGFLIGQDLEKWLAYIGNYDVAECAANARQTDMGDRQKLEEFLSRCHSLAESDPIPAAVTETNIEDNMTAPESTETTTKIPQPLTVDSSATQTESLATATPPKPPTSAKTEATTSSTNGSEKLSFFQVIAKFVVKILYRNKA